MPDDFHRQKNTTEVDAQYWLKVQSTAAMEMLGRISIGTAVAGAMLPTMTEAKRFEHDLEALRFYEPFARAADPSQVFLPPSKDIVIETTRNEASFPFMRSKIQRVELRFQSPFQPLNPAAIPTFAEMKRNAVAHAQYWHHDDKPRPTLVVVHGFAVDHPKLNAHVLGLEHLYQQGYDILLFVYPHHGPRAERGSLFSGYGVFGNGMLHFNETPLHAIHDLRVFLNYLRTRGVERIGVAGISLGGYTVSLLSNIDNDLAFCIPIVPGVSPIDAFLEWQPTGMLLSKQMRHLGVSVAEMRGLIAVHNPLTYAPRIDGKRVLVIGGAGDRITGPRHVRMLHQHYPGSEMHWFPGNHLLHFGRTEYLERMRSFIERCIAT